VVYQRVAHITEWLTFPHPTAYKLQHAFFQLFIMEIQTQEARIILAIKAIRSSKKLSQRSTAKIYKVPQKTLSNRIAGRTYRPETKANSLKLTKREERVIIQYILDLDSRGFAPRLASIEEIANYILKSRGGRRVSKLWVYRFVKRQLDLKTRFNHVYDFQRALCEDPNILGAWFQLVQNIRAKYGVADSNFHNFDETRFIIGIICATIVVTRADRRGRGKAI
jgi:hypothetical protein